MIKFIRFYYRNLKKDSLTSILNILGLSIGLACSIIIFLYLNNELSYDKDHKNAQQIYRIGSKIISSEKEVKLSVSKIISSGKEIKSHVSSSVLGVKLTEEYPEIEKFLRLYVKDQLLFKLKDKLFYEDNIGYADSTVFDFFDHEFIYGNPDKALIRPNSIVLSESMSKKYFGNDNPIGQVIYFENKHDITVTGVFKNLPGNRPIKYQALLTFPTFQNNESLNWSMFTVWTNLYVKVNKSFSMQAFLEKWPDFYEKYVRKDGEKKGKTLVPIFIKLTDIHLALVNKAYQITFTSIGLLILILICINYINLSTARASQRLKEIGVKKALGSSKIQLQLQFLYESTLNAVIALIISFGIVVLILFDSGFKDLISVPLDIGFSNNLDWIYFSFLLAMFIGVFAGLYPSLFLSSLSCINALRGIHKSGRKELLLRQILVVAQFTISIIVISSTLLMNDQINFMRKQELGFTKENILIVPVNDSLITNKFDLISDKLKQHSDIAGITAGYSRPGSPSIGAYKLENNKGQLENHGFHAFYITYDFLKILGLNLVKGRTFNKEIQTDTQEAVLVNKTLVKFMGWEEALGKTIKRPPNLNAKVIGIVEDFNFRSLHNKIEPLIIRLQFFDQSNIIIKIKDTDPENAIQFIGKTIKEINPERPFVYSFLDEDFDKAYKSDQAQNKILGYFSAICIIISCLGLFGLSSFSVTKRIKEIGIRKVMGSNEKQIIGLLIKETFILIMISILISVPAVYIIIDNWNNNFAYKSPFNFPLLILSLLGIVIIALLTVSFHTVKASLTNPVDCLRYE